MATRLLLDENMPGSLAPVLRDTGYDVLAVKESMRGGKAGSRRRSARGSCRRAAQVAHADQAMPVT